MSATQISNFVAHTQGVNAACLGQASGQVLATGGDDKKVNLWRIGRPGCLQTLGGAKSAVEALMFDAREEGLFAGSRGGTARIYDLTKGKAKVSLQGHRSACVAGGFHPHNGAIVASGSQDTNLKVWDVRTRSCVHTYKGHKGAVRCLEFSPDGQWVATGSDDGAVKLWDLGAGRLLTEFVTHRGAIATLRFHPNEFLLATGSSDRCVKFWDLESFDVVSTTPVDVAKVRAMAFTADGDGPVAVASQDSIKLWTWEPSRCVGQCDVDWGRVADVAVVECRGGERRERLLGCSLKKSFVSVWDVDVEGLLPAADNATESSADFACMPRHRICSKSNDGVLVQTSPCGSTRSSAEQKRRVFVATVLPDDGQAEEVEDEDLPSSGAVGAKGDDAILYRDDQRHTPPGATTPHARSSQDESQLPPTRRAPRASTPEFRRVPLREPTLVLNSAGDDKERIATQSMGPCEQKRGDHIAGRGVGGGAFARGGRLCHTPPAQRYEDTKECSRNGATAIAVHDAAAAAVRRYGVGVAEDAHHVASPKRALSSSGRHASVGTEMGDSFQQKLVPEASSGGAVARAQLLPPPRGFCAGDVSALAAAESKAAEPKRAASEITDPVGTKVPSGPAARSAAVGMSFSRFMPRNVLMVAPTAETTADPRAGTASARIREEKEWMRC